MATIGKKFVDPGWLEEGWLVNRSPGQILLFLYMWIRADHSGIIEFIPGIWSAHIGKEITKKDVDKLISSLNTDHERLVWFTGSKLWFPQYIRFQQTTDPSKSLSVKAPFHKKVFSVIKEHGLIEEINKRDPILLKDFLNETADSEESKPYESLTQDYDKGLSKSTSKSVSTSESPTATNVDKALNPDSSLYYFNIAADLKKIIPKRVLNGESDISLEADIKSTIESLDVDNGKEVLIDRAKNIDWDMVTLQEYFEGLKNDKAEAVF